MIVTLFRYGAAAYGLVLQAFYPFDTLPFAITISDGAKESLKYQAHQLAYWSAVVSMSFLSIIFILSVWFIFVRSIVAFAMRIRPSFRESVEKRMAERRAKKETQDKKTPSKRAMWGYLLLNTAFSVATIGNDIIFNRPEDAASFKEGIQQRIEYLVEINRIIVRTQLSFLYIMVFLSLIFSLVRTGVRRYRQRRAAARATADEEGRLAPGEMVEIEVQVQQTTTHVLEGKLVDLSDGMDIMYEKMESYAAPASVNKAEEVLVEL
ncbi:hypothetical protein D9757_003072 [Collybiopsis confluens]|uniref:Uncharacterized protein n=1 Tax=Collybiopsis confluens TaxID=2823264 RepID=A0A8H5HXY8_9AGAR|nr:hypothetical protein D9757_003072 [Collybiopsis confluens]